MFFCCLYVTLYCVSVIFSGSTVQAELQPEEDCIQAIIRAPPCIVVLGSSNPAKASVVNEIFRKPILPVLWNDQGYVPWRTVRFKQGSRSSASLSVHGGFELIGNDEIVCARSVSDNTVAEEVLQISHRHDVAHKCAMLDIRMNSALLAKGCQLVVAQSFDSRDSLEDVYKRCTTDVLPVVIYAVDSAVFSQQVRMTY